MNKETESGRTLLELVMTLAVIGVLGMGAIKIYKHTVNKVKAQNTAKMIKTIAFERQNMALRHESGLETTVKGPHSALHVKNGTSGNHQSYFWVETTLSDKDFCDSLKESGFIQAEFIEVDGVADGTCRDQSKLAFYFKKNPNANVYCPTHSTNCDTYGDATGCEDGYYLSAGVCESCPEHVATCEDENTPITCMSGYNLYGTECSETPPCSVDSDCDVCGTCGQDGFCTTMCSIPEPDVNDSCGDNECIVYDDTTQTCQNKCERKEYLESTGTQWIDTGIVGNQDTYEEITFLKTQEIQLSPSQTLIGAANGTWSNSPVSLSLYAKGSYGFGNSGQSGWYAYVFESNTRYVVALDKDGYYVNGTKIATPQNNFTSFSTNYTITIFMFHLKNSIHEPGSFRCYNSKIKDNETLVRDFIPVLSPSGEPAMFDRVEKKLYYNAGTGEFLTD